MNFIYFLLALIACIIGSATGMGGGIIIKPVFDTLGKFDATTIGILTSITVFSMSIISILKNKTFKLDFKIAIFLSVGIIFGSVLGQEILEIVASNIDNQIIIILQNILLSLIVLSIFIYFKYKQRIPTIVVKNVLLMITLGLILGLLSSFLGIGGGPMNMIILIYFFSYDTKKATSMSILLIFLSQISKLTLIAFEQNYYNIDIQIVAFMVAGAIFGGLIGSKLTSNMSEKHADRLFVYAQILIFFICAFNIFTNLIKI